MRRLGLVVLRERLDTATVAAHACAAGSPASRGRGARTCGATWYLQSRARQRARVSRRLTGLRTATEGSWAEFSRPRRSGEQTRPGQQPLPRRTARGTRTRGGRGRWRRGLVPLCRRAEAVPKALPGKTRELSDTSGPPNTIPPPLPTRTLYHLDCCQGSYQTICRPPARRRAHPLLGASTSATDAQSRRKRVAWPSSERRLLRRREPARSMVGFAGTQLCLALLPPRGD